MRKLIFNASMPRSGSELLQVLLHQNPSIYGSATSPLLEYQFAARGNYELPEVRSQNPKLMHEAFLGMCKGMAESYYAALTDRQVVVEKNRGWSHYYEWVAQWNPDPKMVCMVRDLRSVIASMERIYRKNRHRPTGPDNPAQLQGMTVEQRVQHWLNTQPIGLALSRTLDLFQRDVAKNILFVRYEDLCTDPQKELDRVYEYIGEPSFQHDFENITKEVEEDDSHFGVYGQHSVAKTIRKFTPSDWSDVIPNQIAAGIHTGSLWFNQQFNY
jgi:sulfotransferase